MRILLAVTTHWPGPAPRILEAAWNALRYSGANWTRIFTVGRTNDDGAMDALPYGSENRVHVGPNRGHQEGERDLVWGARAEAERLGCDWVVKSAVDCIHSTPGWARAWVDAAKGMEATIIGDRWPELHNWHASGATDALLRVMPQTKVFAGSIAFLKATWPDADSGFIERDWEIRIRNAGLWPLVRLVAGDEVEATGGGSQQFWNAKAGPLRFSHCHSIQELPHG